MNCMFYICKICCFYWEVILKPSARIGSKRVLKKTFVTKNKIILQIAFASDAFGTNALKIQTILDNKPKRFFLCFFGHLYLKITQRTCVFNFILLS